MKVSLVFAGSKPELDRLCIGMGYTLHPSNSRFGWNFSVVKENGEKRGVIDHATTNKPCLLEIEPRTGEEAAKLVTTAFIAGALEKLS